MKSTYNVAYNILHFFYSMKILNFIFLTFSIFLLSLSQLQDPSLLQLTQGYNKYFPIDNYFYNYQIFTISDMTSNENSKNYRLCFVQQEHKPYLHTLSRQTILYQKKQSELIPYDLNQVIKRDKILDTFFSYSHQTLYLVSTKQLKIIEILDNQIKSTINTTLNTSITQAQFIQTESFLLILTESKVFTIEQTKAGIELKQVNNIQNDDQIYLNVFMHLNKVVYVTDDSVNLVLNKANNQKGAVKNIKKKFVQFEYDIENAFLFTVQPQTQNLFMVFDEEHTFLTFNIDLMSNQSLSFNNFYRLPQGNKCTRGHRWGNYLFLECKNHLIYIESKDMIKCSHQNGQTVNECLNNMKVSHLNIGYHIKAIEFTTNDDVDFLVIIGADKYQIRYLSVNSINQSLDQANQQSHQTQIISVPSLNTFYPQVNIQKVYLININTSLILSRKTLLMATQISQKQEIFCKTVDQNSQQLLNQPAGSFNGTFTVEGFCLDMINQDSFVQIVNGNLCRLTIQIIVKVDALVQKYEYLWYILLIAIGLIVVGLAIFLIIKKRGLDQQYKVFQNEKNGMQALQQTMVTQANQQETITTN